MKEIDDHRAAEIAAALDGRIRTGESIVARRGESGVEVRLAEESSIQRSHPEMYGQLLSANEQISQAGTTIIWVVGLISLGVCAAIYREWFASIGPIPVEKLHSFWTYILVLGIGFTIAMYLTELAEARVYQRWKRTIVEALERAGMGRYHLLAQLEGHVEVKAVANMIKRDQRFELVD